jgi:hypothetical protein
VFLSTAQRKRQIPEIQDHRQMQAKSSGLNFFSRMTVLVFLILDCRHNRFQLALFVSEHTDDLDG